MIRYYDVAIVGAGVTGTALAAVLATRTNVKRVAIFEKNSGPALVNSHPLNNAQTSHDGGTETNYSLQHALEVQRAARKLRAYVEKKRISGLSKKTNRMVLAVGDREVADLRRRFEEFSPHYPDLRLVGRKELSEIEPKVVEGRDPGESIAALVSSEGYAIDYQRLSEELLLDAIWDGKTDVYFNVKVSTPRREGGKYILETNLGTYAADVVIFAAGPYSLLFAHELGYGMDYAILPVAGSFFSAGEYLRGKVYRMQIEGMPFAAIHGDPDILNQRDTRFGPTTKPLPLMERHHYETFWDFAKLPLVSLLGLYYLLKLVSSKKMFWYVVKNIVFDIPVVGKLLFLREARVIVPSIRYRDLKLRRGVGGIRPQILNMKTGELMMGDSSIVGHNLIFNTTPSPGASICLANAERDARRVVEFLGGDYRFYEDGEVTSGAAIA